MLLAILQLFLFMFFLAVIGEPLRFFAVRRLKRFSNLDFIEICILDIYFGGFILYLIAMLPFPFFTWLTDISLVTFCFACTVFVHRHLLTAAVTPSKVRSFAKQHRKQLFDYAAVLVMFSCFLLINFVAINDFVLGSVRDESIHSLMAAAILENQHVPVTLQPYSPEAIIYPQASHVIFASASYMLNLGIPEAVLYVSILFKSLSIFGAYFLGRRIRASRAFYLGLSFVFAFVSSWPLNVTWGGNPFLVGFPLFLVNLGLLFTLFYHQEKNTLAELLTVGLLFGYSGAIMISYLQTLIVMAVFALVYWLIRKSNYSRRFLLRFLTIFSIGLLPLSPFLFRFFVFYWYPGHNIGLPSDFSGWQKQQFYIAQTLQWSFDNISPYLLLRLLIIFSLISLALLLWKTKNREDAKSMVVFALAIFAAAGLLSFIAFFLPADFGIISWGHQGIILTISVNILMLASYIKLGEFLHNFNTKRLSKVFRVDSYAPKLLTIILLSILVTPFVCYRFLADPSALRGAYGLFAVTTQGDYDLMVWMRDNLSSNAVVLVHPFQAGLFIPVISHLRVVFPYSGESFSSSYLTLVGLLENNTVSPLTYSLMQHWNVSYVFVGANVIYWQFGNPTWRPEEFLGNPNFDLVKDFGNSYLFKFNSVNADVAFLDDFEYTNWNQNRWQAAFIGNGFGNATLVGGFGYDGSRCLRITAQAVPTEQEWRIAYWVSRNIYVLNNSDVTLSFYLNATKGFSGTDTFAVMVSNVYHNQSMVITTPNGVYDEYAHTITLRAREGSFNFNLSRDWQGMFNAPLPHAFILELVNYDFDGVPNVAYIDNIRVTSTPIG